MTFAVEEFGPFYEEALPMIRRHWMALSENQDAAPLDMNTPVYEAAQKAGLLYVFTMRDAGSLVGYMLFFTGTNLHYRRTKWATADGAWVEPKARRPRVASRFLDFVEAKLQEFGVVIVTIGCKIKWPALARLLESRGYDRIEVILSKRL